jgi:hypothetical protein
MEALFALLKVFGYTGIIHFKAIHLYFLVTFDTSWLLLYVTIHPGYDGENDAIFALQSPGFSSFVVVPKSQPTNLFMLYTNANILQAILFPGYFGTLLVRRGWIVYELGTSRLLRYRSTEHNNQPRNIIHTRRQGTYSVHIYGK